MPDWAKLWPFGASQAQKDAERLADVVGAMARRPGFFGAGRAPDTLEGRFEVLALHASLAFLRLKREPGYEELAQAFADELFRRLDGGLREAGVGDLTVPKKMRKFAAAFYGRLGVYGAALEQDDRGALAEALARNALDGEAASNPFAAALADVVAATFQAQGGAAPQALFEASGWGSAPA
jgi:cytochrome b pre-mRNA-processing protein 3